MTPEEAKSSMGKEFKIMDMAGLKFDTIRFVDNDGTIHGDFIEAHCSDCRLKMDQPTQLKNSKSNGTEPPKMAGLNPA
jgi:hypothetical protein